MRKGLSVLGRDAPGISSHPASVPPKKKKATNEKMTPAQAGELREMLSALDRARTDLGFTNVVDFAKAAGHGVSTWHAWRRDDKPTSPKFFDLRDFARAVGMDLRLQSLDGTGNVGVSTDREKHPLTAEQAEVLRLMEGKPEALQRAIRDAAHEAVNEQLNPHGPDAEQPDHRART